jgi:hypothetical protein
MYADQNDDESGRFWGSFEDERERRSRGRRARLPP